MAKPKPPALKVQSFADHQVITQPNPLRRAVRLMSDDEADDPIARAEQALAALSGEFSDWMATECQRLTAAYDAVTQHGYTKATRDELFRAAHDIKGEAATFGYPSAAAAAESLCRIIDHAPDLAKVPAGADRQPRQGDPGDRARARPDRQVRRRTRTEPTAARGRRRLSHRRQPRPPRAPRSDSGAEPGAGGLAAVSAAKFSPIHVVMAGLDPAIHVLSDAVRVSVDARVKPGHDVDGAMF